jgi:NAD(P)-dependent dehydrogenase (short-subunit alcohol dehydrogenase family)
MKAGTNMLLENRVAIVTGAARGIGAATAERMGKEGARVAVVDMTLLGHNSNIESSP